MTVLAAHQPQYLPWSGYFDKLDRADVFVLLDDVQFKKNEWQNRNRIKAAGGWQWLTVPVRHRFPQRIDEVEIVPGPWARKHLAALETSYRPAPHYNETIDVVAGVLQHEWTRLAPLNERLVAVLADALGIETPTVSSAGIDARDHPDLRLVDLCRALDADTYLSGAGGRDYLDETPFREADIEVVYQRFEPPVHPQLHGDFAAGLSVVDLLVHCGPGSLGLLRSGRG